MQTLKSEKDSADAEDMGRVDVFRICEVWGEEDSSRALGGCDAV